MTIKLSKIFPPLYKKFIYFVSDRLLLIVFFFHTAFKPSEFVYEVGKDSFLVRKNSSDIFTLKEVYIKKVYGGKPRGVVVDIGAHIGAFSVYASTTADKVYAFEPESSNYDQLIKNIRLNKKNGKIIPRKVAVGRENKKAHIYKGRFNKGASSTTYRITGESETVEMRSLSDLINDLGINKIDLLKIDIEGGEYDLLYGLPKEGFEKIDKLVLEYHYVAGESYVDLTNYLVSLGYKVNIHKGLGFLIGTGIIEAAKGIDPEEHP